MQAGGHLDGPGELKAANTDYGVVSAATLGDADNGGSLLVAAGGDGRRGGGRRRLDRGRIGRPCQRHSARRRGREPPGRQRRHGQRNGASRRRRGRRGVRLGDGDHGVERSCRIRRARRRVDERAHIGGRRAGGRLRRRRDRDGRIFGRGGGAGGRRRCDQRRHRGRRQGGTRRRRCGRDELHAVRLAPGGRDLAPRVGRRG